MAKKNAKTEEAPTFEAAMEALETIVSDLDSGRLPLDELVGQYAKGTELLKLCRSRLEEARGKVEAIDAQALDTESSEEALTDFDPDAAETVGASNSSSKRAASKPKNEPDDDVRLF